MKSKMFKTILGTKMVPMIQHKFLILTVFYFE